MSDLLRREQLLEIAKDFSKHGKNESNQSPNVLVDQIEQQIKNNVNPIVFAIPYNPSFIAGWKKRDKDGLDTATRLSLNNIATFCDRINKVTGKKVAFNLTYDASIGKPPLLNTDDYIKGMISIHEYLKKFNNSNIQIREFDSLANVTSVEYDNIGFNKCPTIFYEEEGLEKAFKQQIERLNYLFQHDDHNFFYTALKHFYQKEESNLKPEADIERQAKWVQTIENPNINKTNARQVAEEITEEDEIFKLLDADQRKDTGIIRLSPHQKDANEKEKYGFSFFPNTNTMLEPWVGVAKKELPKLETYWKETNPNLEIIKIAEGENLSLVKPPKIRSTISRANTIRKNLEAKVKKYNEMMTENANRSKKLEIFNRLLHKDEAGKKQPLPNEFRDEKSANTFLQNLENERKEYNNIKQK
ncbi:MAG: hypothetical protein Ta2D_01160 [Rickettsiales bacterium]|nr:MAG: hypothetical protein Ta2D_01160 [Rickettsiales bacterium]